MFIGFFGIAFLLFNLPLALNYKGLTDRYFNHLARTNPMSRNAKPGNLKFVGWAGVFISITFILGGFLGSASDS